MTSRQGTRNDSRAQSSQATTPQRASSCQATASASSSRGPPRSGHRQELAAPGGAPTGPPRSRCRPAYGAGPERGAGPGRGSADRPDRAGAPSSERTAENASAVTSPGPRGPRARRRPRPADDRSRRGARSGSRRRARGGRPGRRPRPRTVGSAPRSPCRTAASSHPRSSRGTRASGVAGDGVAAPRRTALLPPRPASRSRREPTPGHLAGEAQLVEPPRLVADHPGRQHVGLPLAGGDLEPGQLLDDREQPRPALELGPGRDVLPAGQEPDEVGDAGRLDRGSGGGDRLAACSRTSRWRAHQRPSGSCMAQPCPSSRASAVRARGEEIGAPARGPPARGSSATSSSTVTGPATSR